MFIINATGDEDVPADVMQVIDDWIDRNNDGSGLVNHYVCHDASMFFDQTTQ